MNEIKVVDGPRPFLVYVVNLENAVRGHIAWLDGRQIDTVYNSGGVFICKISGLYKSVQSGKKSKSASVEEMGKSGGIPNKCTYTAQAPVPQPTSSTL